MEFHRLDIDDGHWLRWCAAGIDADSTAVVVLLQGRGEFLEKYREVIDRLAARGLGVIAFDWRGQGLSSRPLADRHKGHVEDFETYIADLQRVLESVVRPRWTGRLILMAHSTGANVGMRFLIRRPDVFASAIFVSPLWGLPLGRAKLWALTAAAAIACKLGLGTAFLPGRKARDPTAETFENNRLTGDQARFERSRRARIDAPNLHLGGPTYAWLRAGLASIRALDGEAAACPPDLPVTVLSAAEDRVVDQRSHRRIADRLPAGRLAVFAHARHELLMESDAILDAVFAEIDVHLRAERAFG